jgi:PAS domain S-box-containing protein
MKNSKPNTRVKNMSGSGSKKMKKESDDKYQKLLVNMTDGFASVDLNGKFLECNHSYQQMTGYTMDELKGMTFNDLTPNSWHDYEWKIISEQVLKEGNSIVYEKEYRRKDGSLFPVELRAFDIKNEAGEDEGMWAIVRDITKRKQGLEKIQNSERTLTQITDQVPAYISLVNKDLEYTFVNSGYEAFFNLKKEEIIGRKVEEVIGKASFDRSYPYIVKALEGEKCDFENWLRRGDGTDRLLRLIYTPYYQNDVISGILTLSIDLTDHKLAEATLKQVMAAFESTSEAIGIADTKAHQIYQNKAYSELFGYPTAKEFEAAGGIASTIKEASIAKELLTKIQTGEPWEGELERVTKEGRVFSAYERADAIKDESGNIIGLVGIIKDITDRKRTEEAIKRSEIEYRSTLDALPEWIYVADENLCFVMLNHTLQNVFYSFGIVNDCIGLKITANYPLISSQSIKEIEQVFQTGDTLITKRNFHIFGKTLYCELIKVPVFRDQKVIKVITVIRDRSKEKEIEILKEKSADEKEILLREIHHRVKNNLSIVISLLNFQLSMSNNQELIPIINDVQLRIRSIALIHDHLYHSETLDRIPLLTYIRSLADVVHSTISLPNVKIETQLEPVDVSIQVALPIGLIISELLTNAVKYAFNGRKEGKITVILKKEDDEMCTLIVKDNGTGLPLDYSLESAKTMGFYIIGLLTEQLEGKIEIVRENGTSFNLQFKNKF